MSLLGILTLLYIVYGVYRRIRYGHITRDYLIGLPFLLSLQAFFVLLDAFSLQNILGHTVSTVIRLNAALGILLLIWLTLHLAKKRERLFPITYGLKALLLLTVLYTEFFNGVLTFHSHADFRTLNADLKPHHPFVPFKLVGYPSDAYDNSQAHLYAPIRMIDTLTLPLTVKHFPDGVFYHHPLDPRSEYVWTSY